MAEDLLPRDDFRAAEDREGLLSYHPLIASGMVLLVTGDRIEDVNAYDLHTGAPLWPHSRDAPESRDTGTGPQGGLGRIYPPTYVGVPRFTMTAHGTTLYVKLGLQATSFPVRARQLAPEPGYLAALDLTAQKKRLFEIHLDQAQWETGWALEGAPVTDGRSLYTAMRRRDNLRAQAHVACFDMKRGRLRWRTFVAAADTLGQGKSLEYTHNLLALDQGTLYFNTNLGAVAALRAEDGRITWLTRYPRAPIGGEDPQRSQRHVYRDVTPCLVHRDFVFVAPGDCDRVFALDAGTGILLWATAPQTAVDVVHLLGVGHGNLIASGSHLYWFDVESGQVKARFPGRLEDPLRGYGRGLLAGDRIYWPTRDRIHVFDQRGPRPVRQPIDLATVGITGGNLATSDDVLIVAGSDRMTAFRVHGPGVIRADGQP
jgi:outer membrane protein assembly factor BamB